MASQPMNRPRVLGDYIVGRQIGSGSFATVWLGRHRVHGTEVAIKEIVVERLNKKLQDSLLFEISILKKINHPNIVRLHDIMETAGRIHLVLEYCRGGDLSLYIQRRGSVPEATAKYFMQQLAAGLQVLRQYNIIHRDLKPQNLLLLTDDHHSVLKIADFGFARSLQPRGLAETVCGSPLYMAPEIMLLHKYDAKADLWSVGGILFHLVTGKPPFTGNNETQLLQNIMKSNELRFPPDKKDLSPGCLDLCQKLLRRNPVERLTFEEFFNHQFLFQKTQDESLRINRSASQKSSISPPAESSLGKHSDDSSEDCLPFILDDDSNVTETRHSFLPKGTPTYSFSPTIKVDTKDRNNSSSMGISSKHNAIHTFEKSVSRHEIPCSGDGSTKHPSASVDKRILQKSNQAVDSLERIDQDYVLVSGPLEMSSSSVDATRPHMTHSKFDSSPLSSVNNFTGLTAPMPISGAIACNPSGFGSFGSNGSAPSGTSQGSMDMADTLDQPSSNFLTRMKSLQQFASAITELIHEKIESGRRLEAFSLQLVILAIWKQAVHVCHAQAASAIDGSPSQGVTLNRRSLSARGKRDIDCQGSDDSLDSHGPMAVCAQIERRFLVEVGNAEDLARNLAPTDANTEMPDAMEAIYQSALALGRHGAVDELMGDTESAVALYSKSVRLLTFLLVEAPSLILNPPFSLTNSDRFRLRSYIDILNNRQSSSMSQRMALLRNEDQPSPSP